MQGSDYSFNVFEAEKHGVECAILINNFAFWIKKNIANGTNYYDKHTWTYNSAAALEKLFPFWNAKKIRRYLDKLIEDGVLIKGNYNKSSYDRTLWYAFADESFYIDIIRGNVNNPLDIKEESIPQKQEMETPKMGSLTDINTDINTHKEYSTASKLTVSNQKNKPVLRNEDITKKLLSLWNNSPFTTNHIYNPESKIIQTIDKVIFALMAGTFITHFPEALTDYQIERNNIKPTLLNKKFTFDEIVKGLENYLLQFREGYWPFQQSEKKKLPKSLADVFYNSYNSYCKSLFFKLASNPPMLEGIKRLNNDFEQRAFISFKTWFSDNIYKRELTNNENEKLVSTVKRLKVKHNDLLQSDYAKQCLIADNLTPWKHYIGHEEKDFELFIKMYIGFLNNESDVMALYFREQGISDITVPIGSIGPGNAKYLKYTSWLIENKNLFIEKNSDGASYYSAMALKKKEAMYKNHVKMLKEYIEDQREILSSYYYADEYDAANAKELETKLDDIGDWIADVCNGMNREKYFDRRYEIKQTVGINE